MRFVNVIILEQCQSERDSKLDSFCVVTIVSKIFETNGMKDEYTAMCLQ